MVVRNPIPFYLLAALVQSCELAYVNEWLSALAGVLHLPGDIKDMPLEEVVKGLRYGLDKFQKECQRDQRQ
jgi:hypothetical protein